MWCNSLVICGLGNKGKKVLPYRLKVVILHRVKLKYRG